MKFKNLNEATFKIGDIVSYSGDFEMGDGYLKIIDKMNKGYLATSRFLDDPRRDPPEGFTCFWIDDNGKIFGKYSVKKYTGSLKDLEDWVERNS